MSFLLFKFWRFFTIRAIKIIFLFAFLLSSYAGAQRGWNEDIAISNYMVEYFCSYGNDKDGESYAFPAVAAPVVPVQKKPAAEYDYLTPERVEEAPKEPNKKNDGKAVEKYVIKLQSKYKSFANYNNYSPGDERVKIQSDLHEIYPVKIEFHSKADVEIYLNGEQFNKLIQVDGFSVYYPMSVFDYRWATNVSKKNNANELWFSTGLSSVGFNQYKKSCHDTIESQRVEFERENNKPVTRLKNFFGI